MYVKYYFPSRLRLVSNIVFLPDWDWWRGEAVWGANGGKNLRQEYFDAKYFEEYFVKLMKPWFQKIDETLI